MAERWFSSAHLNLFRHVWNPQLRGSAGLILALWSLSQQWAIQNVTLSELYPTVLATQIWGNRLANEHITFHTNNQALEPIINQQSRRYRAIMFPVLKLIITCLRFSILFQVSHSRKGQCTGRPPVMCTSLCFPCKSTFGTETARSNSPILEDVNAQVQLSVALFIAGTS